MAYATYFLITVICGVSLVRDRERWMDYLTPLFIVILPMISKVTSLHCSDQQLPASGDDDLQQVTTLQYCLVDNCTIKRIDTGEELDVAYTTDSLIVTTPTDGRTSVVIAKQQNELPCLAPNGAFLYRLRDIVEIVEFSLTFVVSAYIIAIHVMFKELRNVLGKLLILYSIFVLGMCVTYIALLTMPLQGVVDSLAFCYVCTIGLLLSAISIEALGTSILSYIAVIMRRSYKRQSQISKKDSQRHFQNYAIYSLGTMLLALFLIISFDVATGNYKDTLQQNGRCILFDVNAYSTLQIGIIFSVFNKIVQVVRFITYLYYTYKIKKDIGGARGSSDVNPYLHKLAVSMGAFIGLASFLYLLLTVLDPGTAIFPFTQALFLMQQCVIVAIFLCSKKVCRLHGECLSKCSD